MVVYGVKGYVPNLPSSVFDQVYVVDNGRMVMQTDFDLHGHRLLNNGNDLNTNGFKLVKKMWGGFEVDDDGRVKMHADWDLNGHGIHEVLSLSGDKTVVNKSLDLNGKPLFSGNQKLLEFRGDLLYIDRPLFLNRNIYQMSIKSETLTANEPYSPNKTYYFPMDPFWGNDFQAFSTTDRIVFFFNPPLAHQGAFHVLMILRNNSIIQTDDEGLTQGVRIIIFDKYDNINYRYENLFLQRRS